MGKEIINQVQEAHSPRQDKSKEEHTKTHSNQNDKNQRKNVRVTRQKEQITYKGTPIRLSADFSREPLQARREWHDIFKVMKGKNP